MYNSALKGDKKILMSKKKKPKILIVDDEIGIRELLADILSDEGYHTIVAHNAESAWSLRVEERPDLILLDIWMPDTDGVTLLRQWSEAGFAKVPIIVMSGHATIEAAVEAAQLGAVKVMEKPIATNQLLTEVATALARKRETDINPALQQARFGESPALQALRGELLAAAADLHPLTLVGAPNDASSFFAEYLALPNAPVMHVDDGTKIEGEVDAFFKGMEKGLVIFRLFDMLSPMRQSGLLGLLREAARRGIRVVVCSTEEPSALEEKFGFGRILVSILSHRIIRIPPLTQYKSDLSTLIKILVKKITTDTDMEGRTFTPAAQAALCGRAYENDFVELSSLVRSALLYVRGDKVDAATITALAARVSGESSALGMREDVYTLPFRSARDIFEREYFIRLIGMTNGNIPQAAKIAGLERTYFYRKLKQYNKEEQVDL